MRGFYMTKEKVKFPTPEEQRAIIMMFSNEGLTTDEIYELDKNMLEKDAMDLICKHVESKKDRLELMALTWNLSEEEPYPSHKHSAEYWLKEKGFITK